MVVSRVRIDFRDVNSLTIVNPYPFPLTEKKIKQQPMIKYDTVRPKKCLSTVRLQLSIMSFIK